MTTLIAYLTEWHLTRSRAFHDLLIDPIGPFTHIETRPIVPGADLPDPRPGETIALCLALPSAAWLRRHAARCVWLPMWDMHVTWTQARWDALPPDLRVVGFSEAVTTRARAAGLPTLRLQFFQNPDRFPAAPHDGERVALYWNRTGLLTEAALRQFCAALHVDRLIFRDALDPYFPPSASIRLPAQIGSTVVEALPITADREAYWRALARATLFIAPRAYEGAGSAFIEALASGCAVYAHDGATMHEYITHGVDGALFAGVGRFAPGVLAAKIRRRIAARLAPGSRAAQSAPVVRLAARQDWDGLAAIDPAQIGAAARTRHARGFAAWEAARAEYARFVLG